MPHSLSIKNDRLPPLFSSPRFPADYPQPRGVAGPVSPKNRASPSSSFVRFFSSARTVAGRCLSPLFFPVQYRHSLGTIGHPDETKAIVLQKLPHEEAPVPRPKKIRHCEGRKCGKAFKPARTPLTELTHIPLLQDELETLRLCDLQGLTQEQAGASMGISRGTVQRILTSARSKVARALVEGAALIIEDSPLLEEELPG